ncbi:3,4-dihydroxy-2-butanone-4-phosphate synthase [Cupriavidus oxalaticus]|uniref:3,4-dihydroxy-2-butanone 4-phosphate synthase n=1 Tax=Cupriavidus oxalaticus TaxID=96344 RepID=A0A976BGM6_9BURK|nr:3,4-dihydroxy-2-butanone-4-phosphate synthase [Cupriavidus oxalaticus]QRQ84093.1 3,4-dihydroxy-2-butanone-4-phosphate synthase [Cupriavidus oxalaticus]QRQ91818.1 3,4-dihydroxy-2-butanone-4-phosphate synthase [Cupriavidus oxalaticus]WQD86408.1 3,4-dihydroxy-2-butanone-4-phosphate synthase [Cupriavidus oxalaticus]SPC17726.1 3,4-dihydroxy-2-butanone 4-phosphate synthase [Cupriavidus oxalaticus]
MSTANALPPMADVLAALAAGQRVVVIEDETTEATGCVLVAAERTTEADVNFMAAEARGLVCMAITEARRDRLQLPPMAASQRQRERYTVSIEAATGVSTGISAADRALTLRVAAAARAQPADLVQPGHIFPVVAQADGVLRRAGFAEACSDLPRLAGRVAAGAYAMLLDDDGDLLRGPGLLAFAQRHGLAAVSISGLIHHRLLTEGALRRTRSTGLDTPFGRFTVHAYHDAPADALHLALVLGEPDPSRPVLTRVQAVEMQRDVLAFGTPAQSTSQPASQPAWNLERSLARIGVEGCGVLVLLDERESPQQRLARLAAPPAAAPAPAFAQRALGVGAQILRDVGAHKLRLLSHPVPYRAVTGFDLEVTEFVPPGQPG